MDTNDYSSASTNVNLTVSPAPLSATANNASRSYGTTNPVFTGTLTGVQAGDNVTAIYSCGATAGSPVGTYPIVPGLNDPNDRLTNYIVNLTDGTLTITVAMAALAWAAPAPIVYGTPLGTNQLDASANTSGGFIYAPSNGIVLLTGTNELSVLFVPADAVDYTNASATVSLDVTPAPLIVAASNATVAYGQPFPVFGGSIVGVTNGDDITASFSPEATTNSPAGTYSIVPSLSDPDSRLTNYTVIASNGTLTITAITPGLTWATPAPISYGTPLDTNQLNATANTAGDVHLRAQQRHRSIYRNE